MELGTGTSDKARLEWECHTVSLFVAWGLKSTPLHSFLEVLSCSRPIGCLPISPTYTCANLSGNRSSTAFFMPADTQAKRACCVVVAWSR
jgi:hypothetical protein